MPKVQNIPGLRAVDFWGTSRFTRSGSYWSGVWVDFDRDARFLLKVAEDSTE